MTTQTRERYARATQSSDLRVEPEALTDADALLAAGYAAQADPDRAVALTVYRALITGAPTSMHQVIEWCCEWQALRQRKPAPYAIRKLIAQSVLGWMRNPNCPTCHGTGVIPVEGTGGRLTHLCTACGGSGRIDLRRAVALRDAAAAMELADELQRLTALVIADMARRIAPRLDL